MTDQDAVSDDIPAHHRDWLSFLRPGIYHCTGLDGLAGIVADRAIRPNGGFFPFTFPQTGNSYGQMIGAVSLFDLSTPTEGQCLQHAFKWVQFFSCHKPATIALEIDRAALPLPLIRGEEARAEVGFTKVWIPHVEVWHRGTIPAAAIKRCLVVCSANATGRRWVEFADGVLDGVQAVVKEYSTAYATEYERDARLEKMGAFGLWSDEQLEKFAREIEASKEAGSEPSVSGEGDEKE